MKRILLWGIIFLLFGANGSIGFAQSGQNFKVKPFDAGSLFPTWKGSPIPWYEKLLSPSDIQGIKNLEKLIETTTNGKNELLIQKTTQEEKVASAKSEHENCVQLQLSTYKGVINPLVFDPCEEMYDLWLEEKVRLENFEKSIRIAEEDIQLYREEVDSTKAKVGFIYPQGIVGTVDDQKLLMNYLPRLIDILLKFVSPIVLIVFVYAGVRFIYAGDEEEEITKSKQFFMYTLMGVLFVILSYSIMKALYFIFSTAS